MNLFAAPLFQSVADIMPEMSFGIKEINANLARWKVMIADCTENGDKPFVVPGLVEPTRNIYSSGNGSTRSHRQPSPITATAPEKLPTSNTNGVLPSPPGVASTTPSENSPTYNLKGFTGGPDGRFHSLPRSVDGYAQYDRGQRTPESTDDQPEPVYTVLVTDHQGKPEKSSIPRSPQSPELLNGVINGNGRGLDADDKSFVSQTPYIPHNSPNLHAGTVTASLNPITDASYRSRSSPPSIGESQTSKGPPNPTIRHSRSRFNLQKIFRRKRTDTGSPPKLNA